jgi:VanZ family protein
LKKIKPSFIPAVAWLITSFILLTLPGSSLPKENWLDKIWADKWIHIGMFAIMVILFCWAMRGIGKQEERLKKAFIIIAILCTAYGIGMEYVQKYFISNRSFDIGDIIADTVGSVIGLLYSLRTYIKK